jgi:type VI secretion system protein ImpC
MMAVLPPGDYNGNKARAPTVVWAARPDGTRNPRVRSRIISADKERSMSPSISIGESGFGPGRPGGKRDGGGHLRVAILGDFSGRLNRGLMEPGKPLAARRPVAVDRDTLDHAMERMGVVLSIPVAGPREPRLEVRFRQLDDFHPDRLFARLEPFAPLGDLRRRLQNPATFAAAAAELRGPGAAAKSTPDAPAGKLPWTGGSDVLDQALEATSSGPASAGGPTDWQAVIRRIVASHLPPSISPKQDEYVAQVDQTIADEMRSILHHAQFQSVEAAWRGVDLLTRRLETGSQLSLCLVDVSKGELTADLAGEDVRQSGLYRLLIEQVKTMPGEKPFGLLIGAYTFDGSASDAETLGKMGQIAAEAGAPFLAAGSAQLLNCDDIAACPDPDDWRRTSEIKGMVAWRTLRISPQAEYVCLSIPRYLARLPYGRKGTPAETFGFEEFTGMALHENLLWGNPAFLSGLVLSEAFLASGRPLVVQTDFMVSGLPLYYYDDDGETAAKPCAEVCLTLRAAERVGQSGLTCLLSHRNSDQVQIAGMRSLKHPYAPLRGLE